MGRSNLGRVVRLAVVGLVLLAVAPVASAAVRLPAIFSDNMVLQREQPVPVWGWAEAGKEVTVTVAGQSATAKAGADGRWKATLPKLPAGGPHELVVQEAGGPAVTLKNVLVGEVWLCSGQSNMEWPLTASMNPQQEIAAANYPKIRLFNVQKKTAAEPQDDCKGAWTECSPKSVPGFSAVGYFFIRHLHKELDVPAGMIESAWGGTAAEAWTCRKVLESEPSFKPMLDRWDLGKAPPHDANRPANLYNGMIAPLAPFAIRGAIWYQGESNCGRAYQYRTLFPLMINNWRTAWGRGDLPFGLVQLAPYRRYEGGDNGTTCTELREAQAMTVEKLPNVGMAVTMDISDVNDIHPKNKQDVGRRLALWALAKVYEKNVVYSGPIYKAMNVEGSKVRIRFDHVGGGLVTRDGKAPSDFIIAGEDQKFAPATAVIDGDTVVVSSDQVAKPAAVRYGWRDGAEPNLANKEGLPACPFRTDQWKGVTEGRN
jgi:sialate O-acetylesterase